MLEICERCGTVQESTTPKGEHEFSVTTVPATCTSPGYTLRECSICGERHIEDITAALPHNYVAKTIPATCEGGGKTVHICEGCGSSFVTDYTDPLGHSWDEGTEVTGSTCTGEGLIEYRCVRCGYHRLEGDAAAGHVPGEAATCTTPQLCTKCGAVIENALGHDYIEEVTAPTCTEMGYTTYTCSRCSDTYKGDYIDAAGHKPGDWIIDQEPTTGSEGSKHKKCEVCGETLETEEIEKIYNQATTDSKGEAIVGGYLVTVSDTDTKNPVAGATVTLHENKSLSIRLPSGRLLDYADQTTIQVQLVKDKSPVAGIGVSVTDCNDNFSSGKTDAAGQLTVPGGSDTANEDGRGTVGWKDADGDRWTLTVKVEDFETKRPIPDAGVSIGKTGTITVTLPDGTDMDEDNRFTVTVTDQKREPQEGLTVTVKGDLGQKETGETDEDGKLTVPEVAELETHGAYVVGYTDGTFGPDRDMTRSEAATIFARLLAQRNGERITAPTKTTFTDVPTNAWYAGYVSYLARYCALEAELQNYLDTYESTHDYDEYHYDLDEIEHDPYVLLSIISAWHEGEWTLAEVQDTLQMLFDRQYILTEDVVVEVRYRTETRTDSEGNDYDVEVPYNYYICTVTLSNENLSHLPVYILGEEQLSRYALYMATLGNRPDLFPGSDYVGKYTGDPVEHEVPEEYLTDETFSALLTEAEKYIGYPYVWGGSNPSTSFDCSGYLSWVLNQCGWNVGRLGAQGLYNYCTPTSSPQSGDLVFFVGTYDTPGVSHCGLYVGDGWMLHCGDPISYANLNSSYWQSHFYAYGRLP